MTLPSLSAGFTPTTVHDRALQALVVAVWLSVFVTFTQPDRHGVDSATNLDLLAIAKLVSRGIAAALVVYSLWLLRHAESRRRAWEIFAPIIAAAAWGVLSTTWSAKPALTLANSGCFAMLVAMGLAIAAALRHEGLDSRILKHLSWALLAVSVVLVAARFALPGAGTLERNSAGEGAAGLLHPTTAASTASIGLLIVLGGFSLWNWNWARWSALPAILIHGVVLYWSEARLAWALTALTAVPLVATALPRQRLAAVALLLTMVGVLTLCVDPGLHSLSDVGRSANEYMERGQTNRELLSLSGRDEIWLVMQKSFWESPIIGHGVNVTSATGEIRVWGDRGNYSAHNLVLQALVTTGVVGTALLIVGLAVPATIFLREAGRTVGGSNLRALMIALWAWYFGWGLLNVSFTAPFQPEAVAFFVTLGVAAGSGLRVRNELFVERRLEGAP